MWSTRCQERRPNIPFLCRAKYSDSVNVTVKFGQMVVTKLPERKSTSSSWTDLWKCCFQWSGPSCLVLFTCFQWIMYLRWFMARHAHPSSAASHRDPAWIFHREPTGKSKIAQFKEVIKTVHNQYLSLDGHRWGGEGFGFSPPHLKPCSFHWQLLSSVK